jgi:hypothetical protein
MQRISLRSKRVLFAALGLLAAATAMGCSETDAVIAIPGYPAFTIEMSPGVAPGMADGCTEDVPNGRLRGVVYDVPIETRLLPNFAALAPVSTLCLDRLDVVPRRSVYPGFPGLRDRYRWFAVDLQGAFNVEADGLYYFRLMSDDGSQLYIDDTRVIDNDGYHPPRMALGAARLTAGRHTIRVPYWQAAGPMALILEVARPGEDYHVFGIDQTL